MTDSSSEGEGARSVKSGAATTHKDVAEAVGHVVAEIRRQFADAAGTPSRVVHVKSQALKKGGSTMFRPVDMVRNRPLGRISAAIRALDAGQYSKVEGVLAAALQPLFADPLIPVHVCDAVAAEVINRLQHVNKVSAFDRYCRANAVLLARVAMDCRAAAPTRDPNVVLPVQVNGHVTRGDPDDARHHAPSHDPSPQPHVTTAADHKQSRSGPRIRATELRAIIVNASVALMLERGSSTVPLADLRSRCAERVTSVKDGNPRLRSRLSEQQQEQRSLDKFRRVVSKAVASVADLERRGLLDVAAAAEADHIAVVRDAVVNLRAVVAETASRATASTAAPAVSFATDPIADRAFGVLVHLLLRNFRYKKTAPTDADPAPLEYRGHNICCVAVETATGRIVAMDFNQCKADQNLCSHAEKRMCEALTQALRPTVARGTPPSLAAYTVISSLEPCHMCANFVSRMGVGRIGYLMRDPMQMGALEVAARMLDLTLIRPSNAAISGVLEEAFATANADGSFPAGEITSWLGSDQFLKKLTELAPQVVLDEAASTFLASVQGMYPGCIDYAALPAAAAAFLVAANSQLPSAAPTSPTAETSMTRSSTDLLIDASRDDRGNGDDDDDPFYDDETATVAAEMETDPFA